MPPVQFTSAQPPNRPFALRGPSPGPTLLQELGDLLASLSQGPAKKRKAEAERLALERNRRLGGVEQQILEAPSVIPATTETGEGDFPVGEIPNPRVQELGDLLTTLRGGVTPVTAGRRAGAVAEAQVEPKLAVQAPRLETQKEIAKTGITAKKQAATTKATAVQKRFDVVEVRKEKEFKQRQDAMFERFEENLEQRRLQSEQLNATREGNLFQRQEATRNRIEKIQDSRLKEIRDMANAIRGEVLDVENMPILQKQIDDFNSLGQRLEEMGGEGQFIEMTSDKGSTLLKIFTLGIKGGPTIEFELRGTAPILPTPNIQQSGIPKNPVEAVLEKFGLPK